MGHPVYVISNCMKLGTGGPKSSWMLPILSTGGSCTAAFGAKKSCFCWHEIDIFGCTNLVFTAAHKSIRHCTLYAHLKSPPTVTSDVAFATKKSTKRKSIFKTHRLHECYLHRFIKHANYYIVRLFTTKVEQLNMKKRQADRQAITQIDINYKKS